MHYLHKNFEINFESGTVPKLIIYVFIYFTVQAVLIFSFVDYSGLTYGDYEYPDWANGIGWAIAVCVAIPIPIVACVTFIRAKGSVTEVTYPGKHETFNQCWFNIGPPSQTVEQHWTSIGWTSCVCWDGANLTVPVKTDLFYYWYVADMLIYNVNCMIHYFRDLGPSYAPQMITDQL